jgi:rhodanese-related sulfurtransferase
LAFRVLAISEEGVCKLSFKGQAMTTDDRISPHEAYALVRLGQKVTFLDSRNPKAWAESEEQIPGAIRVPADDVESHLDLLDRNAAILAYCT